jgi:hypothetical protein
MVNHNGKFDRVVSLKNTIQLSNMLIISGILINRLSVLMVEYSENHSIPSREETLLRLQAARVPKQKKTPRPIAKVSVKKAKQIAEEKKAGMDGAMDLFFSEMRKRCTGKCTFCNRPTTVRSEELWTAAIAHLLPKSKFVSVATNENNWVELCWNCHTDFDSAKISWEMIFDSKDIEIIAPKLEAIIHLIPDNERQTKLYSRLIELLNERKKIIQ